jgi:hypothetical protein
VMTGCQQKDVNGLPTRPTHTCNRHTFITPHTCEAYLHKEAQVCHQGQAAVLDLLDLQLSQGLRVIRKAKRVKRTTRLLHGHWADGSSIAPSAMLNIQPMAAH